MLDRFTRGHASKTCMADQMPMKRLGVVEKIAAAIVFVTLGKASYMTGVSLSVDRGPTA